MNDLTSIELLILESLQDRADVLKENAVSLRDQNLLMEHVGMLKAVETIKETFSKIRNENLLS